MSLKKVSVIGMPMDLGASTQGTDAGPEAIRRTQLIQDIKALGLEPLDRGDIVVPDRPRSPGSRRLKNLAPILKACKALAFEVYTAHKSGAIPVILGGDHSLAMGSVAGSIKHFSSSGHSLGLIWVDAHGDMNTPSTSPTGNIHGMPLAHLLGLGDKRLSSLAMAGRLKPRNVCLLGVRDLDANERKNIRDSGINIFTMKDIDRRGMARVVEEALALTCEHTHGIHVSFDIDAVDPAIAQGTGTPSRGGLTYREAHLLMELIADSGLLASLDMVEVNPLEDVHNNTAELASELILSALGKRIYG